MSAPDESGWVPIIRFEDQSPSFCHGFEAGGVWAELKALEPGQMISKVLREENLRLYDDLAQHERCAVVREPTEVEGWLSFTFTKHIPFKPRVVQ